MVIGRNDVDAQILLHVELGDELERRGAGCRDDRLAAQVFERFEAAGNLAHETRRNHVVGDREADLGLTVGGVRRRTAFEVDGAVGQERNAGRGRDGDELNVEFVHPEMSLYRVGDLIADVHRIADHVLLVVVIGEWQRGVAVADNQLAGFLNLGQSSGQVL